MQIKSDEISIDYSSQGRQLPRAPVRDDRLHGLLELDGLSQAPDVTVDLRSMRLIVRYLDVSYLALAGWREIGISARECLVAASSGRIAGNVEPVQCGLNQIVPCVSPISDAASPNLSIITCSGQGACECVSSRRHTRLARAASRPRSIRSRNRGTRAGRIQ